MSRGGVNNERRDVAREARQRRERLGIPALPLPEEVSALLCDLTERVAVLEAHVAALLDSPTWRKAVYECNKRSDE